MTNLHIFLFFLKDSSNTESALSLGKWVGLGCPSESELIHSWLPWPSESLTSLPPDLGFQSNSSWIWHVYVLNTSLDWQCSRFPTAISRDPFPLRNFSIYILQMDILFKVYCHFFSFWNYFMNLKYLILWKIITFKMWLLLFNKFYFKCKERQS